VGSTARNVGIILLIAVAIYALPGGGSSADLIAALLSAAITVCFTLIGIRLYRENRMTIFGLGDRWRGLLYASLAVAVFAMAALSRLFDTGGLGALVWFALIGAAAYGLVLVWRAWRTY
jgi:hypothetical protein